MRHSPSWLSQRKPVVLFNISDFTGREFSKYIVLLIKLFSIVKFIVFSLSSCVNIRTRFGCVFLRHCIVKILANASALAPFLPRIVAKTQHRKFFEPKQDKIDCFSRRQVAGILTYFKTDNVEKRLFYLILASSDTNATA
jgi:hypothetical protein